jgi:hypothetical protein
MNDEGRAMNDEGRAMKAAPPFINRPFINRPFINRRAAFVIRPSSFMLSSC